MQHFILLALNLLERPVGSQPCSHLSDKEAGWGRVLPDVVVMFQAVPQSLIPSLEPRVSTFCWVGVVVAVF